MSQGDELIRKIDVLRHGNKGFITNSFFPARQLAALVRSGGITIKMSSDTVIILAEEEQMVRLYFYASDIDSLRQLPLMIPLHIGKTIILDIIGKNPGAEILSNELEKHNFCSYSELIRMKRKNEEEMPVNNSDVVYAGADDADEIMEILYEEFDVFISRLPTIHKLEEAISNREVTIVRQQGLLAGLAYFEKPGEKLKYLYQIVVRNAFRGTGIIDDLLIYTFKNTPKDTVFQLWAETKNEHAINKYRKYGFAPDGLVDYIMLYKGNNDGKDI